MLRGLTIDHPYYRSPTPYEALCLGIPFINPIMHVSALPFLLLKWSIGLTNAVGQRPPIGQKQMDFATCGVGPR